MSIPSSGSDMNQLSNDKFGIIKGDGKDREPESAFLYVHGSLGAAKEALGQLQTDMEKYTKSPGNGNMFDIKQKFGDVFAKMRDVQEGFAAIKEAIPKLDSSEDLNAANKGVEEFETRLTQISGQVGKIAKQWLKAQPDDESINEKFGILQSYQKDLMRVHTQILYSKEIKKVRIEDLKSTIESTTSRTDSSILRWITKFSFVKAVLRTLFGWEATSPSIQQLEQHFKRSKESLEALKLASFDLHDKEELDKLIQSVQTAQNNLKEFSNYMNNIEGDEQKITEFKGLIEEAKGDVDVLLDKLQEFDDDFYSQSFVKRMQSIYEEAKGSSSSSSHAKSAASIIFLCEQAIDREQMKIGDDSFNEEVLPLVSWAQGVLDESLEQRPGQSSSAIEHSTEDHLFLSMCLQGANEILSDFNTLKEESPGSIEQPTTNIPEPINEEELVRVEGEIMDLIAETRNTMNQIESVDDMKKYDRISIEVEDALELYKEHKATQQYQNLNQLMGEIRDLGNLLNQ